jgi:metal-responsive CopG/Arc/MetJ family transcriptional regulator
MTKTQDRKITVSINPGVLSVVDSYVQAHPKVSRSAVFEEALKLWYRQMLDQADLQYYSSLTPDEQASNESWGEITTEAAKHIWP